MQWATALSTQARSTMAMGEVLEQLRERIDEPDLLLVFVSPHHASLVEALVRNLERHHPGAVVLGCSAAGVIADSEVEAQPALGVMAARLPDVGLRPFLLSRDRPLPDWRELLQVEPEHEPAFLLFSDPFSGGADKLLRSLDSMYPDAVKIGGLVSGGQVAGDHALLLGSQVAREGHLGLALFGDIQIEPVVAQGCRAVGPALRVTRCEDHLIHELDGAPAHDVMGQVFASMEPIERQLFAASALIGLGMGEPGREDYLVRHLIGADPERGVVAVAGQVHEGQPVRFHLRDRAASAADLAGRLALTRTQPEAVLMFSCLGRGVGFFGEPDHDSGLVRAQLGPELPIGGFFCNGELGPVGGQTWLHGYTNVLGLVRRRPWS